jgi:hypothetical protein
MHFIIDQTRSRPEAQRLRLLKVFTLLFIVAGEAYRTVRFLGA